jgi:NADP-dependent 3-hydroxy acid dehydrogenase YdfG
MRDLAGADAAAAADCERYARGQSVTLRALAMDVTNDAMVQAAVYRVIHEAGRLDVIIHNAGHMVLGPAEAFTADQLAEVYDALFAIARRR